MTGVSMPALPQSRSTSKPVEPRQHHVEQHEIERLRRGAFEPALPVGARLDGIALAREPIAQRQDQARLVLNEQQPLHALCESARLASSRAPGRSLPFADPAGARW